MSGERPAVARAIRALTGIAMLLLLGLLMAAIANAEDCPHIHDDGVAVWCCPPVPGTCTFRRWSGEVEA